MRGADERGLLNWKLVSCADHLTDEMTDTGADDADCDIRDYGSHHQARRGTLTLGHLHRQICSVDGRYVWACQDWRQNENRTQAKHGQ